MEIYADAISDGNSAVITKQDSEDRLVLNIGNIPPGSTVITQFKIIAPIEVKNEKFCLMIPAAIFPFYQGEPSIEPSARSDIVVVRNCSYRMDVKVLIKDRI